MSDPPLTPGSRVRKGARWLGLLLVALSLLFVGDRIWESRAFVAAYLGPSLASAVLLGAFGYAAASVLLALAWHRSLLRFGARDAGARACIAVYGRTQLAKYVPGNVFHFVGRHAAARGLGYPDAALAWAALNEVVTVCLAAAGIALSATALRGDATALAPLPALAALVAALTCATACLDPLVARVAALRGTPLQRLAGGPWAVAAPLLQVTVFMAASGALLLGVALAVSGPAAAAAAGVVVSGTAVSWLAGFVTPGASAGAGVREAVLILWLEPVLGTAESTTIALAWRLVTIGGDGLFFAITLPLSPGPSSSGPSSR